MKKSKLHRDIQRIIQTAAAGTALVVATQASAFNVTSAITGWWEQPNQQNHGLVISTSQLPDGSHTGVIFWAHYDADGDATWLLGQGELEGASINADLYQVSGIDFMQPAGTRDNPEQRVGELTVTLSDCASGEAVYSTELMDIGSGRFEIARLTRLPGLACSGGITDDIPATSTAERFDVALVPGTGFAAAQGHVEWVLAGGEAELEIEIDNVPSGEYRVIIGGIDRGQITARPHDDDGAEGEIEFNSPQEGLNPLLDFDPRGETIQITQSSQTVLSGTLPTEGTPIGLASDPVDGERSIRQVMTNAGVYPSGEAIAEWEQDDGRLEFEVDVEDIPQGRYTLRVDTIDRGILEVKADDDGDTDGEIEFHSPARAGLPILDFDPRGSLIELIDGDEAIFFTDFGSDTATTGDDDDDTAGDGGWTWSGADREIRFRLDNQGVYPRAEADVYYSLDEDGLEFEVEIEDVPAGAYTLTVGGVERGTIEAVNDNDGDDAFEAEGEIEFSENPDDADELLLDFAVRGEPIEVLEGETVVFAGTFPEN